MLFPEPTHAGRVDREFVPMAAAECAFLLPQARSSMHRSGKNIYDELKSSTARPSILNNYLTTFGLSTDGLHRQTSDFGVAQCEENNMSCELKKSQVPLTRAEEHQFFIDVQDLLFLENQKLQLDAMLGRGSTDQEWADWIGCSICRLYARIAKGRAAKRKMIAATLPLVGYVAKEFSGQGLSYSELFQEGALGLVKSTEKFDASFGTKFSTYAYFWIREKMLSGTQKFQQLWRVAKSVQRRKAFVLDCKDQFREQHNRNPSLNELAVFSNIDKLKIRQTFSTIKPHIVRTEARHDMEDKTRLCKEAEDPESDLPWLVLWHNEVRDELAALLRALSVRESQVLHMKYGLYGEPPLTLVQIAASLGVSHEAVRMAEKKALQKLRKLAEEKGLRHYIPTIKRFKF